MQSPMLARYEILGRLATGGMAEVWLARSKGIAGFEKLVVIKTILPQLAQNQQFVSMFVNEGRLAAMLSHPNCVQIFDLGQEGEVLYIAMEYLEGFSLARVMKRAKTKGVKLSDAIVARIIMDAASGLDYSHRLKDREGRPVGLVHRDVSPDNLLVGFSGQVKVVDFGIAKAATPALLSAATTAGTVKGKHGYIAPEYLLGRPLDGRADVFALGVVLYRAISGRRPFVGETEAAISLAVLGDPPRPLAEFVPGINPALVEVVMMALEKDPARRFESARAMRQALEIAVGRAAENEEVADLMNSLWPAGDEERVALHNLSTGQSEESSSPALHSVVSGTFSNVPLQGSAGSQTEQATRVLPPTMSMPFEALAPAAQAEQVTRQLPWPIPIPAEAQLTPAPATTLAPPPPASGTGTGPLPPFDTSEQPVFEEPAPSRRWMAGLAVVVLVAIAGLGIFFKDRKQQQPAADVVTAPVAADKGHLSVTTPVVVKVFEGKQELGSSPLELDLPPGPHTLRLSNKALGIDQTLELTVTAGQTSSVKDLAKGSIVVKAEPWAYVKIDGKQLGQTPIPARPVYEGVHVVELNNTNLNESRRLEVKVKAGETRTVSVNLEAGE